ncbi:hypothetical protein N431DRAFT_365292 [Stipitochalara longipes BDJ]|nr:hypothetical protein N431DRAFT_365292 [Stipitochalara longipes BDJ]
MSIQPLSPGVIAQIKSSTTITSLNGVVCELVKNSLDASSKKMEITVDYSRGSCVLEDDGLGILPAEFSETGGLGKLYHSSKLASQAPVHGGRGTFLASLSAMSLLSITSHHHQYHSHNTITMHKSAVVSRQTPSPPQLHLTSFSHGTRVAVRDLFGNMPVRVKQRARSSEKLRGNSKEWEELKRDVVLLLLAWPKNVAVTIRESVTNEKLLIRRSTIAAISASSDRIDCSRICALLVQASLISVEDKPFWISTRASTPKIAINAAISLLPSVTKHTQFISFGIQPLVTHDTQSVLHDEINRMFLNSSFGNNEAAIELDASEIDRRAKDKRYKGDGFTNRELKGGKKGIDRWPMFYIDIRQNFSSTGRSFDIDEVLDDQGSSLAAIMELLQAMIWEFLIRYHFRPKANRGHQIRPIVSTGDERALGLEASNQFTSTYSDNKLVSAKQKGSAASPRMNGPTVGISERSLLTSDNPFDLWTRVKVGSRSAKCIDANQGPQTSDAETIPRPFSAPPSSTSRASALAAKPSKRSTTPLVSSNGKVVRRPFEDVAISAAKSRTKITKAAQQAPERSSQLDNILISQREGVIAWINPVTKVKSFVNQRTGLTIRSDTTKASYPGNSPSIIRTNLDRPKLAGDFPLTKEEPSPWLKDILKTWTNPVFCPVEASIPQATFDGLEASTQELLQGRRHHCTQIDIDRAFKQSSVGIDGRISKAALGQAELISQVDNKFILVKLKSVLSEGMANLGSNNLLVLIDQHAADERIRIETLWEEFFAPPSANTSMPTALGVRMSLLDKSIHFDVSIKESRLLSKYKEHFVQWGIIFDLPSNISQPKSASKGGTMQRLTVHSLPPGIIERCKLDSRLLIDLIRTEVWKVHDEGARPLPTTDVDWLQRIHNCPQGIIDMLNSRACRSAIMFNDELNKEQCQTLVSSLAKCKFPFQCAHGRPSLVPLVDLGRMDMRAATQERGGTFGAAFNKWKDNMK